MRKLLKNKPLVLVLLALLLFGIYNLIWLLLIQIRYHDFIEATPKSIAGSYITTKDGDVYNLKIPDYLHFTGNLGIVSEGREESLIVWPKIFGGYDYGIILNKDGQTYEIYVNEKMELIDKEDENSQKLLKDNKAAVDELISKADDMWNIK
ncbi:hypothetical protein ABEW34_04605 [Paenibacillus algorifonticola]|uniref:hypothetical protein n=1 Tax=Paenibacillus algorifonticola TaxID=684063 RepID=UPI003D2A0CDA